MSDITFDANNCIDSCNAVCPKCGDRWIVLLNRFRNIVQCQQPEGVNRCGWTGLIEDLRPVPKYDYYATWVAVPCQ